MSTAGALRPQPHDSRPGTHGSGAAQAAAPQTGDGPLLQQGAAQ
jgi:hypothetical protein